MQHRLRKSASLGVTRAPKVDAAISPHTYWKTLISAVVANAAPTHLALTFPSAKPSLIASDFRVSGHTVSSASWTGAVLTIVLGEAVLVFEKNIVITFLKTGQTHAVTNNVADDTNTMGWYDGLDATTITKDGANLVSQLNDKLGSGRNLTQSTDTKRPIYNAARGIIFSSDGTDELISGAWTFNQPEFIYMVFRLKTWVAAKRLFDGIGGNKGAFITHDLTGNGGSRLYAGTYSGDNKVMTQGSLICVRGLFNGDNSKFQFNNCPAITGNFGASNMSGFVLGNRGDAAEAGAEFDFYEAIVRKSADNDTVQGLIVNYLKNKYSFKEIIVLGDSTVAVHTSGPSVVSLTGFTKTFIDFSLSSSTIAAQKTFFLTGGNTGTDAVFVQVGLNNLLVDTPTLLAAYQDLIDTIRAAIGATKKIAICTMIPCNKSTDQQYIDLNAAILGQGATPITGVDARINTFNTALNAGDGTLAATYDSGDHLHENEAGRQIIANLWAAQLTTWGLM